MTKPSDAESAARRRTLVIAAGVLIAFAVALAGWAVPNPARFVERLGISADIPATGWIVAAAAAALYTSYTLWAVPEIRPVVTERSLFRLIGIPLAVLSGVVEEMFFRHVVMDWLAGAGAGVLAQIAVSALLFAVVHSVWGLFGHSWRDITPILYSTFGLGVLMAVTYLASDRLVLPAVAAHIAINLIIEPGLLLNAAQQATHAESGDSSTSAAHSSRRRIRVALRSAPASYRRYRDRPRH